MGIDAMVGGDKILWALGIDQGCWDMGFGLELGGC